MSLDFAHPCTREWFARSFPGPTLAQTRAWPSIAAGESTLLLAPTGSGKTLAAFLASLDRAMFGAAPAPETRGVRVLYISPIKALGVDVERNLRAPLAGLRALAQRDGIEHRVPRVGVRSGDTPQRERQRLVREPPEILITTPESLYLMLTSRAAETLRDVETLILDEIHSLVPSKRGTHLALSLERLEALRDADAPSLQRVGLSATQRPLDEVARFLGGGEWIEEPAGARQLRARPVTIVDARDEKVFDLLVQVPVEDLARLDRERAPEPAELSDEWESPHDPSSFGMSSRAESGSIWPAVHGRLVQLVRDHRSTMIFVNSRRLAERLAEEINALAGEELVLAHHGSLAKDLRASIEERLKAGQLPAIVATSSLELGIDIGAVDLVVQIEAPLSVASGIQRIGRAGHQVGAVSRGVIFPKYRGDLLACAAVIQHVREGRVESTHYPRNPLDVLAQHVVSLAVAEDTLSVESLYDRVRQAAPYADLPRRSFEGVLDMLSGRYPADDFGDLRPRITWDRVAGEVSARRGARMLAIANAGTIPDRGLYGVFLAGEEKSVRVGELDEEMVFESRVGDIFILGATSWRIEEIGLDRVLVSPAPGQPGRMPFWHGDRPGRPLEFGRAIGSLARELERGLGKGERDAWEERLRVEHGLDERAARNLVDYVHDQGNASGSRVPSDRRIVVERFPDPLGDWVLTVLSPFGGNVHAAWVIAVRALYLREHGLELDAMWGDDGIVFRVPEGDAELDPGLLFPDPAEVEALVTAQLGQTALFASRFRENAARSLLLPRRRPGQRLPLWLQRRKSAGLLEVASRYPDFPIVLETYRECLQDVLDLPGLVEILGEVRTERIRLSFVETERASPFAAALTFNYVANFMYEGDAPLAERRAQALSLDHTQLRELLGEPELRELLDASAIREVEAELSRARTRLAHPDTLHDLLLGLGDQSLAELAARVEVPGDPHDALAGWLEELERSRRIIRTELAGELRFFAVEDASRYRDALGVMPPPGIPLAFLDVPPEVSARALPDLVHRFARTHGPFRIEDVAARFGIGTSAARAALQPFLADGRVLEGEFLPHELLRERGLRGGDAREYCGADVLRRIKRKSLARLRQEIEAVAPEVFARFSLGWHGIGTPAAGRGPQGPEALLQVLAQLQGVPLPVSELEAAILPSRLRRYDRRDLDELCASGEVVWRGVGPLGARDGRVTFFLRDHLDLLAPGREPAEGPLVGEVREALARRGALFFRDLCVELGSREQEIADALWELVWAGEVTNDSFAPLRAYLERGTRPARATRSAGGIGWTPRSVQRGRRRFSRRSVGGGGTEGRWTRIAFAPLATAPSETERRGALVAQLLERHGVLTREVLKIEGIEGGFSSIYPVLKAMEEAGRVRRGYFVEGLGATQFAWPGCDDELRSWRELRQPDDEVGASEPCAQVLASSDPANPYGAALPWPSGGRFQRSAGARVLLYRGVLLGMLGKGGKRLQTHLPAAQIGGAEDELGRDEAIDALVRGLATPAARGVGEVSLELLEIDGVPAARSPLVEAFVRAGFRAFGTTLLHRPGR